MKEFLTIDGIEIPIEGERNILELARKAGIDIPSFCYHSELSIYGACRLCMVDIEGRGLVTSCSTIPENGMMIRSNTKELREIRKTILELLLANHDKNCTTCGKNQNCRLQELSRRFGIDEIEFKQTDMAHEKDRSSLALVRDPNKCILCGDCIRFCDEIQSVGALGFANRGADVIVTPAFGKDIADVDCVNCGQCARVCPVGAITVKNDSEDVWADIDDPKKTVVAQIAPAIRVALGEYFGMKPGTVTTGQIVAALKQLGFDQVYDTSFTADLTIIEETTEFLERVKTGGPFPMFTSCCPGWVKFAEQYFPKLLGNISSCKSPQQMFGSLAKEMLPALLDVKKEDVSLVSVMPCTAKKFEAGRPEFSTDGMRDVDHVITTQELGHMIEQSGMDFKALKPAALDLPLGFKTGAGVIFGNSGGVTEAVLRFASEKVTGKKLENVDFKEARGEEGIRELTVDLNGTKIRMAVVYGLGNARQVCEDAKNGKCDYHFVEVMACPGGCIGGAGQPATFNWETIRKRGQSLYEVDKTLQLHKSQDNPYVQEAYKNILGEVGGHKAHELLHTGYQNRKRISDEGLSIFSGSADNKVEVGVCVGTNCYVKGSQTILTEVLKYIESRGLQEFVEAKAAFCFEKCSGAPVARVGEKIISECTLRDVIDSLEEELAKRGLKASV